MTIERKLNLNSSDVFVLIDTESPDLQSINL